MRTFKDYILLFSKGIAMGAADLVPGVSGGTIAFITGIYQELLDSINAANLSALKILKSDGLKSFWKHINGNFLLALLLGIGVSAATLAKLITYLLDHHTILLWSFFFGLIVGSIYLVGKTITKWNLLKVIGLLAGTALSFYITILPPVENPEAMWYIFMSGAIAICAMILPGISGSFILLLLGSYELILTAIKDVKLATLTVFALGCLTGLISFSKLLSWMFKKYHDLTIAILTGFLVGSLNKIWPWKNTIEFFIKHEGEPNEKMVPLIQENILPQHTADAHLILAIAMAVVGLVLIIGLEKFSGKKN